MSTEKIMLKGTLIFLIREGEVLLAVKGRKIGAGSWNGYGGGLELGETVRECASRELKAESGLVTDPSKLIKMAVVDFHNTTSDGEKFTCRVHVFFAYEWQGYPKSTVEMLTPKWFSIANLPLHKLMLADPDWLPTVLAGQKIFGEVFYGPKQETKLAPTIIRTATDEELIELEK